MSDGMDFSKIMKMVGNLQQNAAQMQERLASESVSGDAGGGMVVIEMNGLQQVTRVHIDPELLSERVEHPVIFGDVGPALRDLRGIGISAVDLHDHAAATPRGPRYRIALLDQNDLPPQAR